MIEQPSIPKIIDSNIFDVDTNKERDIKIIDIDIEDRWNINIPPIGDKAETVGELNDILEEALSQKPE